MVHDYFSPKATLILANGEKPSIALFKRFFARKTHLFALDGAGLWLFQEGFTPDLVIGDMDSMTMGDLKAPCLKIADQESNDLEKALLHCQRLGLTEISLLGAFGLRADHFLTNIAIMSRFSDLNITMIDDHQCAFICPENKKITFDLPLGSFISFFPLSDQVGPIWSLGVDYPLSGEMLGIKNRLGTLNRIKHHEASLLCEQGPLLVIAPANFS